MHPNPVTQPLMDTSSEEFINAQSAVMLRLEYIIRTLLRRYFEVILQDIFCKIFVQDIPT
jgi:hypothetical protein